MLPLGDPQFWIVTVAAVAALAFVLGKRIRVRKKGNVALPCDNCPQAEAHAVSRGVAGAVRRWILGQGKPGRSA